MRGLEQKFPAEMENQSADHRAENIAEAAEEAIQHEIARCS